MGSLVSTNSVLRRHATKFFPVLLAIIAGPAALHATNTLTATPTSASLSCNTATGPGASTNIVIKPVTALTGVATTVVTFATPLTGGLTVTPSSQTLNAANSSTGVTFTAVLANGCAGVVNNGTPAIQFKAGATNDVSVTVTTTHS